MDSLFNSKFMQAINKAGQKLGSNKFVSALQSGMMSSLAVIMVGAIFQIIQSILGPSMLRILSVNNPWYGYLNLPYEFTMNFLAVWVVILMANQYAKNLKLKNNIITAIDATVIFFLMSAPVITSKTGMVSLNTTYLGAQGLFVGYIIVGLVVKIEKFCSDHNIKIKMPEVVPPALQASFSAILPLLFEVIIFGAIFILIQLTTQGQYNFASGLMAILGRPLKVLNSTPGVIIIDLIGLILWSFGIHGSMIIMTIMMPLWLQAAGVNAALHAAGKALKFNPAFLWLPISTVGGTGNTISLVLMGLRAKSKQIKAISKASLIPGLFCINEPVTFGMPIMYNPIMIIPYVLNTIIIVILYLIGYKSGILGLPYIPVISILPIGGLDYVNSLNLMNLVWPYLMIIPSGIIWYPFFKAYDKQLYEKEQSVSQN
ncbi:PTS transporter subunit EIIC [Lactobacillus sp. R2/2]|nr:PTS transporter subunit EIIC [Lactobacillus sp. R2/2]